MEALTPMMQQYMQIKKEYPDCILFYRLGDFYEMFFEDAILTSKELEITLTGKSCGMEEKAPMCGVPYHAVDNYLSRLILKGYKVAICEQVEDPKQTKGIVRREVIRIVTPGTNLNMQTLESEKNNYLMCIVYFDESIGISICDITTGEFLTTETDSLKSLVDEINKFNPTEIICNDALMISGIDLEELKTRMNIAIFNIDPSYVDEDKAIQAILKHYKVMSLTSLGIDHLTTGCLSAGALLQYLIHTQKNNLEHIASIKPYSTSTFMLLDSSTRRNLELSQTLRDKNKKGSLLGVLDKTKTAMGARMLRQYIEQPLILKEDICKRLDAIENLINESICREEMREYLHPIYDLERLLGKIAYKTANPRDLIAFSSSIAMIPHIKYLLEQLDASLLGSINDELDSLNDLSSLIDNTIIPEPPISTKDGGLIKSGYLKEIDELRLAKKNGKNWLIELETKDRDRTGIKNLKIKYNKVFGYYYEVTNSYKDLVPEDYIRKQTLANAERYTNDKLKDLEDVILNAEDKLINLEIYVFNEVRDKIAAEIIRIKKTAHAIAKVDVLTSLANVAMKNNYVKPKFNDKGIIDIKEGRHPVVESMISSNSFITNDTHLDNNSQQISIITGPNMAGKSTYMRQVALIVLMAQIGSFVPANYANISLVDRIFTRVGASDDLASGQSTFMVEMNEVANILRNATKDSLLILDEIGRGTSTLDGLSIAWAVIEHISDKSKIGAKTLFATHYHELTELEGKMDNINNYCIAVKENGDDIIFLRKINKGGTDKSYGIQVAKLAGVPDIVIERSKEILASLSMHDLASEVKKVAKENAIFGTKKKDNSMQQLSLFNNINEEHEAIKALKELDLGNITPIEALNILSNLQIMANKK